MCSSVVEVPVVIFLLVIAHWMAAVMSVQMCGSMFLWRPWWTVFYSLEWTTAQVSTKERLNRDIIGELYHV